MRQLIFSLVVLSAGTCYGSPPTHRSTTTKFYSQSGRPQGRAVHQGNTTRFYSQSGRPQGRAVHQGNTTKFYSQSGRPQGKVVTK